MEWPDGFHTNTPMRAVVPSTGEVYEGGALNVVRAVLHGALGDGRTVELGVIRSGGGACPDDGACHHSCMGSSCFRVRSCGPLSGVYQGDVWPAAVVRARG